MKILLFSTHPIQYHVPLYRELSKIYKLKVIYLLKQTQKGQAKAGFGVKFDWDIPLLEGYTYKYLNNLSKNPSSSNMNGIILDKQEIDQLFKNEQPGAVILQGWFPKGMKQIINYCYRHNIKSICRGDSTLLMKNHLIKKIAKELYIRNILKKIDYFLYVGEENKKYYLHYGVKKNKLFPALHAINTPYFKNAFKNSAPRIFDKKNITIGFAGKFIAKKQPLFLLKAINQSKYKSNINTIFIGDGPLRPTIESYAKDNNLKIKVTGFLNQSEIVKKGYALIDLLVLPSKFNETWGLVVNEVMTGGIPCIVSDKVGCSKDLIKNGITGYTFKHNSAKDLCKKMELLVEKMISRHSFKEDVLACIEKYSLENTLKGHTDILNQLASIK